MPPWSRRGWEILWSITPTEDALHLHLLRVCRLSMLWDHLTSPMQDLPSPAQWGWKMGSKGWELIFMRAKFIKKSQTLKSPSQILFIFFRVSPYRDKKNPKRGRSENVSCGFGRRLKFCSAIPSSVLAKMHSFGKSAPNRWDEVRTGSKANS